MAEISELLRVPIFADLPEDQIAWFISHAEEMRLKAGDTAFRQSDPADAMFVILEGQLQARGEIGGETVVIRDKAGRRDRRAAVFKNETVHHRLASGNGRPGPAFPHFSVS